MRPLKKRDTIVSDMKKTLFSLISLCGLILGSQAVAEAPQGTAQPAYAEIVFVQGGDILILRSNGQTVSTDPIGLRLFTGDQVQTGAKTSVELVTVPRRSRLRLSENTVVTMGSLGNDGSTTLGLLYGRLRSKVEKMAGTPSPYKVNSQTFMAGVRGTDFGCDVLVSRPGEKSATRVYCFEGSVEVAPQVPEAPEAAKAPENEGATGNEGAAAGQGSQKAGFAAIIVSAGSMAVIGEAKPGKAVDVVEKPIDAELKSYWKVNDFTSVEPVGAAMPGPATSTAGLEAPSVPAFDLEPIRKGLRAKNGAIFGASIFFTGGAALEIASFMIRNSDPSMADGLARGGAICAATGLPVLIYSISINPLRGNKR